MLTEGGAMPNRFNRILIAVALACLAGCASTRPSPAPAVVIHYQHVANAHEVRFTTPLAPRAAGFVAPRNRQGFWAIFVVCSVDVIGPSVPRFVYDVNKFRIDYNGRQFGPLTPYSLRFENSAYLNGPAETPVLAEAIAAELQQGPSLQVLPRGFYESLNYRLALFIPRGLDDYAGEQLTLSYLGQDASVEGNGYPPYDIPVVGGSGAGVASRCLP
jgi:hypothetical protein